MVWVVVNSFFKEVFCLILNRLDSYNKSRRISLKVYLLRLIIEWRNYLHHLCSLRLCETLLSKYRRLLLRCTSASSHSILTILGDFIKFLALRSLIATDGNNSPVHLQLLQSKVNWWIWPWFWITQWQLLYHSGQFIKPNSFLRFTKNLNNHNISFLF